MIWDFHRGRGGCVLEISGGARVHLITASSTSCCVRRGRKKINRQSVFGSGEFNSSCLRGKRRSRQRTPDFQQRRCCSTAPSPELGQCRGSRGVGEPQGETGCCRQALSFAKGFLMKRSFCSLFLQGEWKWLAWKNRQLLLPLSLVLL